jgi:hypothetical protein
VLNRNKLKVNTRLAEENSSLLQDKRFDKLFKNKDFEIDVNSEHFNKKKGSSFAQNTTVQDIPISEAQVSEKIVNPELIKLKEKLLSKKRQKIDKFLSHNDDIEIPLEKRLTKKEDSDNEFEIVQKIKKIEVKI